MGPWAAADFINQPPVPALQDSGGEKWALGGPSRAPRRDARPGEVCQVGGALVARLPSP